jgi:hypothetical protein
VPRRPAQKLLRHVAHVARVGRQWEALRRQLRKAGLADVLGKGRLALQLQGALRQQP